ncbi:heme-dependent oxidative N-demethylase family protein [Defluviimonas sp. SAOS-178_SWC]|uniref:heme-dependent oxidative N-demethylase family protein n=1 Tax=Defluviimonas sp. SAOS-178_SWC TaxID=3121287 RepID=UPI0032219713
MTVLQTRLPAYPWMDPRLARLPGILPLDPADWLRVDEAYAGQMAVRDRLIADRPSDVLALTAGAVPAAAELYRTVLADLPGLGFRVSSSEVVRPDGVTVALDPEPPLRTLGRLVQEDLCLMEPGGEGEHVLTGAVLCFPASWTLAEKIGHPLVRIHVPVRDYDAGLAPRVQRLFDAIRPERPLWRMNYNRYMTADLFQPRREGDPRPRPAGPAPYIRCERQCLLRLPETGAVVFSIHTYVVAVEALPEAARAALEDCGVA